MTHISRSAVEQEISLNFKLVGLFGQLVGDEDIRDATIATSVPIPTSVIFLHSMSVLIYSAPVCCAQCQAHMSVDQTKRACSTDNVMQVPFLKECLYRGKPVVIWFCFSCVRRPLMKQTKKTCLRRTIKVRRPPKGKTSQ
jgi:hypothetical protein